MTEAKQTHTKRAYKRRTVAMRACDLPPRCDTCYYSTGTGEYGFCQYILIAGVSRDCPADENCTKYLNKLDKLKRTGGGKIDTERYMTDRDIREAYRQAKKPAEQIRILAQLNGISTAEIKAIIGADEIATREASPPPKPTTQRHKPVKVMNWTPELDARLKALRTEGLTFDAIGAVLGCSGRAASNRYRRANIQPPSCNSNG